MKGRKTASEDPVARLSRQGGRILGRRLTVEETGKLHEYARLVSRWNSVARLVGSGRIEWIVDHIVLDSLLFTRVIPAGTRRLMDLGSGCGVPGIPLAIVWPEVQVVLVESRQRRVSFLRTAIRELHLTNVVCVGARAEALGPEDVGGPVDALVARCSGPAALVRDVGRRFVRPGGTIVVSGSPGRVRAGAPDGKRDEREVIVPAEGATAGRRFIVLMK